MGTNKIRDTIITAFEVTRATENKVPMLLLSNPGLAKTSIVNEIGEHYGYHVVSLIGSGFENNEILGFQVNEPGKECLTTKNPTWYQTILEKQKEGTPCILFIDELSVCPSLVQGALYRLIFERTIGNGNTLPDDCVIISAGNFKDNLPSYCDITSPSLNRFCVINLCPDNYMDFLDEFSQDENERIADWPEFKDPFPTMTDAFKKNARAEVKNMMMEIFECYANERDSGKGMLDITNKNFAEMFEGNFSKTGEVYNFISGRTYEYMQRAMWACAALDVPLNPKRNQFIDKMVQGLIGAGTGSFEDVAQTQSYLKAVQERTRQVLKRLKSGDAPVIGGQDIFQGATSIADKVAKLSLFLDGTHANAVDTRKGLGEIYSQIMQTYADKNPHETLTALVGQGVDEKTRAVNFAKLTADITAVEQLIRITQALPQNPEVEIAQQGMEKVLENYKFYAEFSA